MMEKSIYTLDLVQAYIFVDIRVFMIKWYNTVKETQASDTYLMITTQSG